MTLTDRAIKNLKPTTKHQFIADGHGLYLRVHPTGAKTFVYRSRRHGRPRWVSLGAYPDVSLVEARHLAQGMVGKALPSQVLVGELVSQWFVRVNKDLKRPDIIEQRVNAYLLPKFKSRTVASLTKAELTSHLTELAQRAPVAANRFLSDLKAFLVYAEDRGVIESSPLSRVTRKSIGGREFARERVMSQAELVRFIDILRTDRFAPATRLALAWLLLTGARSGEVRGMNSSEFRNTWTIPKERAKNGIACDVPLVKLVKILSRHTFKILGNEPFKDMPPQVLSRAMSRMKFDPPATPHDLRRTMATTMAELGVLPHVIEACLNHKMPGVAGIYNRATYMQEKTTAYRTWHKFLLQKRSRGARARAA